MAIINTFERTEKKYLLTNGQFDALSRILAGRMTIDQYGRHTICNIYYDTDDYQLIRASIEKPEYKEKLRLRSYSTPQRDDPVFLELKKKCAGVVYKRRERMPLCEAENFLSGKHTGGFDSQILREIGWFLECHSLSPKVLLSYERIALYANENPGLRVTFDHGVRWRCVAVDLSAGDWGTPLLSNDERLMEIKLCGSMPLWLSRALSELEIFPVSFSKYGEVYQERLYRIFLPSGGDFCA